MTIDLSNIDVNNLILNMDSYKPSQWLQYPPGMQNILSYVESRGGKYDRTLFVGLQVLLKSVLNKPITEQNIVEAAAVWKAHGEPFNEAGWRYILTEHGGYLPVRIRAVQEGSVVPVLNALMTIEATDEKCGWLVSPLETMLLRAIWYPTTVATKSWHTRKMILKFLEETGDPAGLNFKLHDFGARGVSSFESAGIGGMAHLATGAMGTDTITGALFAMKYYNTNEMPGFSIPATEHSTITSWGRVNESKAYENMIKQFAKPGALFAIVLDSYDVFKAAKYIIGDELRQQIIDSGAVCVVRPDSGHPASIVLQVIRILDAQFGSITNSKGYKVLNHVRVIQGDGINPNSIKEILSWLTGGGYSADNVAFGEGGEMLQVMDRDTQKFAMKCCAIKIDGMWHDVFKDPITDPGKVSKRGRIELYQFRHNDEYVTLQDYLVDFSQVKPAMQTVFENGRTFNETTFAEVRARANEALFGK